MATFAELQDAVLTERFDPSIYRERVKGWLNDYNRRLHRRLRLPADQVRGTLTTQPFVPGYAQPADCTRVLAVYLPGYTALREGVLADLQPYGPGDAGCPTVWVATANRILLGPTPDNTYALELDYLSEAPKMTADTDTPSIPEEYHDLLVLGGCARGYFSEEDFNMASAFDQRYETEFGRLAVDLQNPGDDTPLQVPGCWGLTGFEG